MLRSCRDARPIRFLLLAAAIFAVTGSFGLHPEPLGSEEVPTASADRPEWDAGSSANEPSHGCLACLAHRSVSLTGLAVFVPAFVLPRAACVVSPLARIRRLPAPTDDGRAPPSLA